MAPIFRPTLILIAGFFGVLVAVAQPDPFVGTFENADGKIVIESSEGGYSGKITYEGATYPFTAKKQADTLSGKFTVEGEGYAFTATLDGDTLTLVSDGETHVLKRKGTAAGNPLAKKSKAESGSGWKLFKHPLGVSMAYPADWTTKDLGEDKLLFLPPGISADAPKEIILLGGLAAEGITDPKDARITAGADELVAAQIGPGFKRKGGAESAKDAEGKGITLLYEGDGPEGKLQIRLYTTILKDYIVGITAILPPDKMKQREPTLKAMFATLRIGKAEIDEQLVGRWSFLSETVLDASSSGGRKAGDASLVGNKSVTATLSADGSISIRTQGMSIASGSGMFIESKTDDTDTGIWCASDGKLMIVFQDGSSLEYGYRLESGRLVLTSPGKTQQVWQRG